jgi:hypothetical protein
MYCYLYGESDQKVNSNSPVIKRTQLNLSTNIISTVIICSIKHRILATFSIKKKFNSDRQWTHSGKRLRMCEIVCWWRKCAQIESWKNKNIDGFYMKMPQKGGFSNQTATYFLRSRLFTYDIMKNFNCNYM